MHVVDGQHRKVGFELVTDFLESVQKNWKYPKISIFRPADYADTPLSESLHDFWQDVLEVAIVDSEVCLEVHLGLDLDQEQQMFVDLKTTNICYFRICCFNSPSSPQPSVGSLHSVMELS